MAALTLDEAVKEYLREVRIKQRSLRTLEGYEHHLKLFREFSRDDGRQTGRFGGRELPTFDKSDLTAFLDGLDDLRKRMCSDRRRDIPVGKIALHSYCRSLRAFFRWCFANEYIEKLPRLEMPKMPVKQVQAIRDDEADKMIKAAREQKDESVRHYRDYAFCLLLAYSGARRHELVALHVDDLEFDSDPPMIHIRHGKGDKERRLPLHPDIQVELLRYVRQLRQNGIAWIMFSDRNSEHHLHIDVPNRILERIAKAAGVDYRHVSCHKWRHAFCSRLANRNVNLATIQTMAGHADIATTRRYVVTTPQAQLDAMKALSRKR
jgi:site-specific recombinase XerD